MGKQISVFTVKSIAAAVKWRVGGGRFSIDYKCRVNNSG